MACKLIALESRGGQYTSISLHFSTQGPFAFSDRQIRLSPSPIPPLQRSSQVFHQFRPASSVPLWLCSRNERSGETANVIQVGRVQEMDHQPLDTRRLIGG